MDTIISFLNEYKTPLLIISIIIIVLFFAFTDSSKNIGDKYIIPDIATDDELKNMKVY